MVGIAPNDFVVVWTRYKEDSAATEEQQCCRSKQQEQRGRVGVRICSVGLERKIVRTAGKQKREK